MNYSISEVTREATMAVITLWLPPVYEWYKTEKKNGNINTDTFLNVKKFGVSLHELVWVTD